MRLAACLRSRSALRFSIFSRAVNSRFLEEVVFVVLVVVVLGVALGVALVATLVSGFVEGLVAGFGAGFVAALVALVGLGELTAAFLEALPKFGLFTGPSEGGMFAIPRRAVVVVF